MDVGIKAVFTNRRAAELALEHLVQDIGLERTDIFIAAVGVQSSSGTKPAGADVRGSLGEPKAANPALEGEIDMSVGCTQENVERVSQALQKVGGQIK
ncbi:hypothetical protein [Tardiphaga sp.]|uniref:hypothetical protein n=1 Tax=Tardiphaga sp. TaxID=1926292 RepID=UPI0037DA4095